MHHEQDMRRMGALRKVMPVTGFTFVIGWLAIAGVPPFAGFWSKDEILLFAWDKSPILWAVGMLTALLTAYYMTRQVILVFFGEARWHDAAGDHGAHGDTGGAHGEPHESPASMTVPLVVLAALSAAGGLLQLPFSDSWHRLEHWLHPVVEVGERKIKGTWAYDNKYLLMAGAIAVALLGLALARAVYAKRRLPAVEPALLADGWRYDSAVSSLVGGPGRAAFSALAVADARVVDGAVVGTGRSVAAVSSLLRRAQSGFVRFYAAVMALGVLLVLAWFVWRGLL